MKRGFLLLLFVCILTSEFVEAQQTAAEEYVLFSNQKTNYKICLAQNPSPSEQWAAKELQHWLKVVSGADFPIQN
ncbi:MAG TPA: hypothetical protein VFV68_05725, partial [Agriterribacter sp.]|nr:hypothetical protein [Agriterribacter sp.]